METAIEKTCLNCERVLVRKTVYRNTLESVFNFRKRKYCSTECYIKAKKGTRGRFSYGGKTKGVENR